MSPGQTGHITGQMGRVPGTDDGTHTRGCPAKILYVYWFFSFPNNNREFEEVHGQQTENQEKASAEIRGIFSELPGSI